MKRDEVFKFLEIILDLLYVLSVFLVSFGQQAL